MNFISWLNQRHAKNFSKYLMIGILFILLNIFFMWLFIDILLFSTLMGASIVAIGLFLIKFYAYLLVGLIKKQFLKYLFTTGGLAITNIILMWLFVETFHIPTIISSTVIIYSLFILRFIVFDKIGLIKHKN